MPNKRTQAAKKLFKKYNLTSEIMWYIIINIQINEICIEEEVRVGS